MCDHGACPRVALTGQILTSPFLAFPNLTMLATWLLRVFTWDGILPFCILAIPYVIHWALPNKRGLIEITAVALPIVAFFTRVIVGNRHIASNNCSHSFRKFQFGVFFLTIIVFIMVDCVMILSHLMPNAPLNDTDYLIFAILIGLYLLAMAVAMYPGPPKPLPEVLTF